jgi:hypothetical protein
MSREEIIAAIRKCARKLGRSPTRAELKKMAGVSLSRVKYLFRGMTQALREAGFDPQGPGHLIRNEDLLLDWARLARKLGKLPAMTRYEYEGKYSHVPFVGRYGSWRAVPAAFARFAREKRLEKKWNDVLTMIEEARAVELRRNATVSARERGKDVRGGRRKARRRNANVEPARKRVDTAKAATRSRAGRASD